MPVRGRLLYIDETTKGKGCMEQGTKESKGNVWQRVKGFVKRHKKLTIVLVVVIVIIAIIAWMLNGLNAAMSNIVQVPQTLTLERMDLEQTVSGTGKLQSSNSRDVTSSLSYEIKEIFVEEGDRVEQGDLLAKLDTTELDKNIAEAQKNIKTAQDSDALALAQAERQLQDAINTRDINKAANDQAVVDAEAAIPVAQNAFAAAETRYNSYMTEYNRLKAIVDAYYPIPVNGDSNYNDYINAKNELDAYVHNNEDVVTGYNNAQAAVASAQSAYEQAVATAESTYRANSIAVENAQDNVNTQKQRDSAATYRTQLKGYQDDKKKCSIEAPMAGTITAMTAEVGASAGGSALAAGTSSGGSTALFTIEDTNSLEITTSIPEYDMVLLQTRMQATITSDALDGEMWTGSVKSISPKATDTSGNFTVVVEVTSPVGELAIGMSAKVNIITEQKKDVFAVPYDAVTTNEKGESVVYVWSPEMARQGESGGNAPPAQAASGSMPDEAGGDMAASAIVGTPIVVETGMETDYYIEIKSGELQEGMLILADPEGKNVNTGNNPGFIMMGGAVYNGFYDRDAWAV